MSDKLTMEPEKDGFTNESPIRAFTDFTVHGAYAIGKGFRPSLAHLTAYLDAMQAKEGWSLVQIIEATAPTMIFRKQLPPIVLVPTSPEPTYRGKPMSHWGDGELPDDILIGVIRDQKTEIKELLQGHVDPDEEKDDPSNPRHYGGWECGDIGERLSANGYQILKYCWRLGKKDDPCKELGKAYCYGQREADLLRVLAQARGWRSVQPNVTGIKYYAGFLEDRIEDQPQFTQNIARMLWAGYGQRELQAIMEAISEQKFHMDCGRGLAI